MITREFQLPISVATALREFRIQTSERSLIGSMGGLYQACILPLSPHVVIDSHALGSTCPPFAFGPVYTPVPVGIPESYSRCWVGTWPLQPHNEITEFLWQSLGTSCPHLSHIGSGTVDQARAATISLCNSREFMGIQERRSR
jgi:hypothetical protein